MNRIDRLALGGALDELKQLPFRDHPTDMDLATWILELAELVGHLAGLAVTALSTSRPPMVDTSHALRHRKRLDEIGVVGDDVRAYATCRERVDKLIEIESLLAGT